MALENLIGLDTVPENLIGDDPVPELKKNLKLQVRTLLASFKDPQGTESSLSEENQVPKLRV